MLKRLAIVLLAVVTFVSTGITGAGADEEDGGSGLWGYIEEPEAVEGVEISAYVNGSAVETVVTDADGSWEMDLAPGSYRVALDPDTIPDDLVVADPGPEHEAVNVLSGRPSRVIFNLGEPGQEWRDDEQEEAPEDDAEQEAVPDAADQEELDETAMVQPDVERGAPFTDRLAQTALAGLVYGLIIALCSVGLSLIFGTTRMINFAHGDMVTFGGLMGLLFTVGAAGLGNALLGITLSVGAAVALAVPLRGRVPPRALLALQWAVALGGTAASVVFLGIYGDRLQWQLPLVGAAVLVVLLGAALGGSMERFIWRPLRKRNVALIQMFIVSIGIAILLRHVLLIMFGGSRMNFREYRIQETWSVGPLSLTPRDFMIMLVAIAVLVLVASMLQFTRIGKAMRAVSDNRDLAESSGINVDRVTLYVWMLGGGLASLGGVLFGLNVVVHYEMGFFLLLLMFAGVILGGLGTAYGAMVGGIFIGLIAQLSTLWFPIQLMEAWALALMIIMLLVRPQGILGSRERVG